MPIWRLILLGSLPRPHPSSEGPVPALHPEPLSGRVKGQQLAQALILVQVGGGAHSRRHFVVDKDIIPKVQRQDTNWEKHISKPHVQERSWVQMLQKEVWWDPATRHSKAP